MNAQVWGPHAWEFLHAVTFDYPNDPSSSQKKAMKKFFHSLAPILPCNNCKNHFSDMLNKYPVDSHLTSKEQLTQWLVFVHNKVNIRLGKKPVPYSVVAEKFQPNFGCTGGTCGKNKMSVKKQNNISIVLFLAGISILLFALAKK